MSHRALFLDRDGVITIPLFRDGRSYAPRSLDDFQIYPESYEALNIASNLGFKIVIVTNQPDINNQLLSEATLKEMNEILLRELPIDAIEVCPHTRSENCDCRKPQPGMLLKAAKDLNIDTAKSVMIGDRQSDVEAGKAVGCKTVYIDRGYTSEPRPNIQDYTCFSILEAARWLANH